MLNFEEMRERSIKEGREAGRAEGEVAAVAKLITGLKLDKAPINTVIAKIKPIMKYSDEIIEKAYNLARTELETI